ncbi:MAG TPA: pectate lyase [Sphingomonas sp.]|nr:pectate lyase [Sphingomonas sp.]
MAEVIGYNEPAPPLTIERIEKLPESQQAAWRDYLRRSEAQLKTDRAALAAELKPGETPPLPAKPGSGDQGMPLDRAPDWYASAAAHSVADTIVSFQTPAGGWAKNQDRAGPRRLPGQPFSSDGGAAKPDSSNFDAPRDAQWTYVGTLDNGATITEMAFLARVAEASPGREGDGYRASFIRGVRYLLAAQYPNGGWPQVWPLQGGYHDGVTFNDNAVAQAAMLLRAVATEPRYRFVPAPLRTEAASAVQRAIEVILAAQVKRGDRLTGWPQQADSLTLAPISARNYEPRSIASAESTDVLLFLMQQPRPSAEVRKAIEGGIAWLHESAIYDQAWTGKGTPEGRRLVPQKGAGPIWSRNYDIATNRPIFGDRDKSIHDDVLGISIGRRNGYSWYVTQPERALAAYADWQKRLKNEAANARQ